MIDDDSNDEKIIAIPFDDPSYNTYTDISQLPTHIFEEMKHFFKVYKSLENMETAVDEVKGAEEARNIIQTSIDCYKDHFDSK